MSSLSGRAVTSEAISEDAINSNTKDADSKRPVHGSSAVPEDIFVPHVYDFVSIARNATVRAAVKIPPVYLGPLAADQSIIIGNGASFSAFKRALADQPSWSETRDLDGLTLTIPRPTEKLPKHIVYKVARVAFNDSGHPSSETRAAMKAAMMELYALVHPPLQRHPNVLNFLGLAWGSNYFDPLHRLPVLIVEYAEHGNLAQLQSKIDLEPCARLSLALDVGEGIKILHKCGIIHGDVKSENILIFSHTEKTYVAKVADFGFSLVGAAADEQVFIGGTRPWKAPEAKSKVLKSHLEATDVYSYGLMLWRLATDGQDPFRFWATTDLKGDPYLQFLEQLKSDDVLLENTPLENWFIAYMSKAVRSKAYPLDPQLMAEVVSSFRSASISASHNQNPREVLGNMFSALKGALHLCLENSHSTDMVSNALLLWAQNDCFYGKVSQALKKCLSLDPSERSLDGSIQAMRGDTEPANQPAQITLVEDLLLRQSYDHHSLDWTQMRDLEPAVQSFILQCFTEKVRLDFSLQLINPPDSFILASYLINGYGADPDYHEAKRLILLSSKKQFDHWPSRAFAYRILKSLDPNFVPDDSIKLSLYDAACAGSRMASIDLKEADPEKYITFKDSLRNVLAGVGADFFFPYNMLAGFTYWQWVRTFENLEVMVTNFKNLNRIADYKVNKRGDRILHLAVCSGKNEAFEALLDSFPTLTIDQLNDQGETPLLCACRAGQMDTVITLLTRGANPSIATSSGESCLHWLVSFDDENIEAIGTLLMGAGANPRLSTRRRIAYSIAPATIEVDFQFPGTPLLWAVHNNRPTIIKFLLEETKDATICLDWAVDILGDGSPLQMAAMYHHTDCLKIMVDAFKDASINYTYGPFILAATRGADTFSMILRNGSKYKENLSDMFDFLLEGSKSAVFGTGIGEFGSTLLFTAVSGAKDNVVEYLLSSHVDELMGPYDLTDGGSWKGAYNPRDLERHCGRDFFTPLLEATRWNRKYICQHLLDGGANPKALGRNPYTHSQMNWTALHVLANAGHHEDVSLAAKLVQAGVPVDGDGIKLQPLSSQEELGQRLLINSPSSAEKSFEKDAPAESPFLVAVSNNAFKLATELLLLGANINYACLGSGLIVFKHSTTILGHLIASAAQHTIPRLRYLLNQCPSHEDVDFIVEEARNLSVLHLAAMANRAIFHRSLNGSNENVVTMEDYDMVVNGDIMHELLEKWHDDQSLNLRSGVHGRTALHLAVEAGNFEAIKLLRQRNADCGLADDLGLTPSQLASALLQDQEWLGNREDLKMISVILRSEEVDGGCDSEI